MLLSLALVCALLLALGACGFRPLYGPRDTSSVPADLALIEIKPIKDRVGQELHNHLLDMLNPRGEAASPRYTLTVALTESAEGFAVQKTAFATRSSLTVTASFTLAERSREPKTLVSGSSAATSSYDILRNDFATLAAEKDARSRALLLIAEDIRVRLAAHFQRGPSPGEPAR
jgi:LPS-assembly lipoprotein